MNKTKLNGVAGKRKEMLWLKKKGEYFHSNFFFNKKTKSTLCHRGETLSLNRKVLQERLFYFSIQYENFILETDL